MRTIIAVMLSWPPRAFARSTSCPAACAAGREPAMSRISPALTRSLSPSEQRMKTSPATYAIGSGRSSTSTSFAMPSARMILFASGCLAASSALDDVAVDHLLDHRVVLGDLRDRARVHEVDAAVADVRDARRRPRARAPRRRWSRADSRPRRWASTTRDGSPPRSRPSARRAGVVVSGAASTISTIVFTASSEASLPPA